MVSPGGSWFGLGFIKDVERLNVALSRAQDGLAILGGAKMIENNAPSRAIDASDYIIQSHGDGCGRKSGGR